MPKKVVVPKIVHLRKNSKRKKRTTLKNSKLNKSKEKILIENFVSLQKVMTNLAMRFDHLSHQISRLLELFEISARAIAQKGFEERNVRETTYKSDSLAGRNKTATKGVSLMHKTLQLFERFSQPKLATQKPQEQKFSPPPKPSMETPSLNQAQNQKK